MNTRITRIKHQSLMKYLLEDVSNKNLLHAYYSSKGQQAVILYRLSRYAQLRGFDKISILIRSHSIRVTGADISPKAKIESGFKLGHSVGVVIGPNAIIGHNCFLQSGVTIGARKRSLNDSNVVIKNDVEIGSGAKIIGNLVIGSNAKVGANCVVLSDIPDGATAVGIPSRIVHP
ncbi:serine O-acetyltransferase [Lacticaseibacillus kribbianus]|uniref:serine O-acetyltransferase n=1 Tax=Lacticaseibacillus kribbianus TaxID=2926292 RepID=UPI001CD1C5CD|nr:serine acetyltransferase [Lacticaseibacillus kribbianus]